MRSVPFADAGVFGALALAAGGEVQVEAEVLRPGVGRGPHLDDDAVGFAGRQRALRDKARGGRRELERGAAGGGLGGDGDRLGAGRRRFETGVVERDLDLAVGGDEELGLERGGFKQPAAPGAAGDLVGLKQGGAGEHGDREEEGFGFHGKVDGKNSGMTALVGLDEDAGGADREGIKQDAIARIVVAAVTGIDLPRLEIFHA